MISRYVLLLTLALLVVYMVSTFITLLWLACPFYGNLARFMANYQVTGLHSARYTLHSPIFWWEISEILVTTPINCTPGSPTDINIFPSKLGNLTNFAPS